MDDRELFERFEQYAKEHGYTADDACKIIGAKRASFFNWKSGKPIGAKAKKAMRLLVLDPAESTDPFLQIVHDNWQYLTDQQKGTIAGEVSDMASPKKKPQNSDGDSVKLA